MAMSLRSALWWDFPANLVNRSTEVMVNIRNYPATLFSESGSDMFFCFHSYPDCAKDPNMVVARHIKDPLAIHSKAEMTNAVGVIPIWAAFLFGIFCPL